MIGNTLGEIRVSEGDSLIYPKLRLACNAKEVDAFREWRPSILVSFPFIRRSPQDIRTVPMRDWALDSGAFSAKNSGMKLNVQDLIDFCRRLRDELPPELQPEDIFALDVIGEADASIRNCETMWKAGVEAIPTYHQGVNRLDVLAGIARDYPKIALGGLVVSHEATKQRFLADCFARVWPKKIHGFACTGWKTMLSFPFHSIDSASWTIGPANKDFYAYSKKGRSTQFIPVKNRTDIMKLEVRGYMEREAQMRWRWQREMKLLAGL